MNLHHIVRNINCRFTFHEEPYNKPHKSWYCLWESSATFYQTDCVHIHTWNKATWNMNKKHSEKNHESLWKSNQRKKKNIFLHRNKPKANFPLLNTTVTHCYKDKRKHTSLQQQLPITLTSLPPIIICIIKLREKCMSFTP